MISKEQAVINGLAIYPFSFIDELLDFVVDKHKALIAINAEKISNATDELKSFINANIGYADGVGAVLGMKKKGYKGVIKIPGCELWLKIIEKYQSAKSFCFIGGQDAVIETAVNKLKIDYPLLNVVYYHSGYFDDDKKKAIFQEILDRKPDVVMVAMGTPRQELLMKELLRHHPALYMGLGGSFDVYIGKVKRAPGWCVKHNLEFAYRLLKQPWRLKRQLVLIKYWVYLMLKKY